MVRLTDDEIKAIKDTAVEVFGDKVSIWLFGSQINPELKGNCKTLWLQRIYIYRSKNKRD